MAISKPVYLAENIVVITNGVTPFSLKVTPLPGCDGRVEVDLAAGTWRVSGMTFQIGGISGNNGQGVVAVVDVTKLEHIGALLFLAEDIGANRSRNIERKGGD